jgi:hypothetical protein
MLTFEHALAAAHRLAGFGDLIEVLSRRRAAASSSRLRGRSSPLPGDRGWQLIQSQVGALDQEH